MRHSPRLITCLHVLTIAALLTGLSHGGRATRPRYAPAEPVVEAAASRR